jgi:hypothetical protein
MVMATATGAVIMPRSLKKSACLKNPNRNNHRTST